MVQHPNEDDLLYSVAEIYDLSDVKFFFAWVEVIRRNDVITQKLATMPYLTQALARPTEFLRLLGPTDENEIFRSWWTWCKLLADTSCGRNKKASIEATMLKIALIAHLVIGNTQSQSLDLVDRLCALRLVSVSRLVVRLTDDQYFHQHRGLNIAPTDAWRNQSSNPIQTFTVAQNISNDGLYETVARLRKIDAVHIQLWMVNNKVDPMGAKNSAVAEPMLARVDSKRL
jgi:hypothetical protein